MNDELASHRWNTKKAILFAEMAFPDHFSLESFQTSSPMPATWSLATLLPSASFSLKHTVSAQARIEPAQPFRIYRHMLSISTNYFIAGGTSH
jgi:hypothetical protein